MESAEVAVSFAVKMDLVRGDESVQESPATVVEDEESDVKESTTFGDDVPTSSEIHGANEANDADEADEAENSEDDSDDDIEEDDGRTITCGDIEVGECVDKEVEHHTVMAVSIPQQDATHETILEASRTALFRRYSKLTPSAIEEHEKSYQDSSELECPMLQPSMCPSATLTTCQNEACIEQIRWRDARIAELQAALDHMTEAMAIQQRDIASQRVFVSRQAEQLTNLSIKLHQEKVSLHVERERFQKSMSTAKMAKQTGEKLRSPVKKLLSVATSQRTTIGATERINSFLMSASAQAVVLDRATSSTQLRLNLLVAPIPQERSSSLSSLATNPAAEITMVALTPPKVATKPQALDMNLVDVALGDGGRQSAYSTPTADIEQEQDHTWRPEQSDSTANITNDQKKPSLGDRLRSIRWTRS